MKPLMSLASERFRSTFMVFYVLSSLIPILIMLYVIYQYVRPALSPDQIDRIIDPASYGLIAMLAVPLLGLMLMSWWISSLEKLTEEIKLKTSDVLTDKVEVTSKNEVLALQQHIDGLYGELQGKITQLNEYSTQLVQAKKKLSRMAVTDDLTTLFNRRHFEQRLLNEIKKAEKSKGKLSLIMIDVDGFTNYNEEHGHKAGDALLRGVGLLIKEYIGKTDLPFRYGADEFAIIMPGASVEKAAALAQQIRDAASHLSAEGGTRGAPARVSVSCGVVSYNKKMHGLMSEMDRCLHQAKAAGKGSVVCLSPANQKPE